MVGPGASLGLPGAAARQKGSGSEEQLEEPHAAPPITTVCMHRDASPSSSLGCHRGSEAPKGSGFSWPSSPHQDDFPPEREAPRCLRHCFLFIPAVEINPVSSEPGERHELISYIWW